MAGTLGLAGAQGSTGLQGSMGPQGVRGLSWRGDWDAATPYERDDAVAFAGSSYVAVQVNSGRPPPGVEWVVLASVGKEEVGGFGNHEEFPGKVVDVGVVATGKSMVEEGSKGGESRLK